MYRIAVIGRGLIGSADHQATAHRTDRFVGKRSDQILHRVEIEALAGVSEHDDRAARDRNPPVERAGLTGGRGTLEPGDTSRLPAQIGHDLLGRVTERLPGDLLEGLVELLAQPRGDLCERDAGQCRGVVYFRQRQSLGMAWQRAGLGSGGEVSEI